eukprot:331832-Chlamydomonas_euryale.AAC.1
MLEARHGEPPSGVQACTSGWDVPTVPTVPTAPTGRPGETQACTSGWDVRLGHRPAHLIRTYRC